MILRLLLSASISLSIFALEQNYFLKKEQEHPVRDISIIATDEGYYPKKPVVFVGEKVRFFVTSTTKMPTCFILKDKEVYLEAKKGEISEGHAFFNKPGVFEFVCPAGGYKGNLVVLEHPRDSRERIKRELASQRSKKVKVWRPKDE